MNSKFHSTFILVVIKTVEDVHVNTLNNCKTHITCIKI